MTSQQYVYVMKGLTKTYAGARPIVEDVWLSFYPGAKIGVLGLNGSGKSSLLRIMAGEDKEYQGEAWIAEDVPQCGYCQSGQIMTAAALLSRNPDPDEDDVNSAMRMNICRCGTYNRIRKGIMSAAKEMKNGKKSTH